MKQIYKILSFIACIYGDGIFSMTFEEVDKKIKRNNLLYEAVAALDSDKVQDVVNEYYPGQKPFDDSDKPDITYDLYASTYTQPALYVVLLAWNNKKEDHSASSKALEIMKFFIARGASVNRADKYGTTPLMLAASLSDIPKELINYFIIDAGADINKTDVRGDTALDLAINEHNFQVAQVLIENRATYSKEKALENITSNINFYFTNNPGIQAVLTTFIKDGVDIHAKGNQGNTILNLAAGSLNFELIDWLLGQGSEKQINTANDDGDTPLLMATGDDTDGEDAYTKTLELLIQKGGNALVQNTDGASSLFKVITRRNIKNTSVISILTAFKNMGGNLDASIAKDEGVQPTLFVFSLISFNVDILKWLLKQGVTVDVNKRVIKNNTSIGFLEMAKELLNKEPIEDNEEAKKNIQDIDKIMELLTPFTSTEHKSEGKRENLIGSLQSLSKSLYAVKNSLK